MIVSGALQIALGILGIIGFLMKHIGALVIVPTITLTGIAFLRETTKLEPFLSHDLHYALLIQKYVIFYTPGWPREVGSSPSPAFYSFWSSTKVSRTLSTNAALVSERKSVCIAPCPSSACSP